MRVRTLGAWWLLGLGAVLITACGTTSPVAGTITSPAAVTESAAVTVITATTVSSVPIDNGLVADGFTARIRYNTGSVPPPYNYSWQLELAGSNASFTWKANYASENQQWSQDFTVTLTDLQTFVDALNAVDVTRQVERTQESFVGAPSGSVDITDAAGHKVQHQLSANQDQIDLLNRVQEVTVEFIPASIYESIKGQYDDWAKSQGG